MIRNVLLDLDDTILAFHPAERAALSRMLRKFGIEPTEDILNLYHRLNEEQWRLLERGIITREQLKLRRYRLLLEQLNRTDLPADAMAERYEDNLCVGHYFIPGAPEMLEALHGKYRLYLVSNGNKRVQDGRLASAGIRPLFDEVFVSEDIGLAKPNPAYFACCFARIPDFRKEETVIVGDSLTSDIAGGHNAGITTIWFNPHGQAMPEPRPDHTITTLDQLAPLLARLCDL